MSDTTAPRSSKRELNKARTRLALMRSAIELFEKHGFESTTVEDIVAHANSSSRTFFRYFGSKEDVLFGEHAERTAWLRETLSAAHGSGRPLEVLRSALIEEALNFSIHTDTELEARCVALWSSTSGLRGRWAEIVFETEHVVSEFLAHEWGTDPEHPDCRINAMIRVSAIRAALMAVEQGGRERVESIASQAFDYIDTYVGIVRLPGTAEAQMRRIPSPVNRTRHDD